MCGNTNPEYHQKVLDQGVQIAFDRFGLQGLVGTPFDSERIETLLVLLEEGYEDQILLAGTRYRQHLAGPAACSE